jgi:hypothetical protein
MSTPLRIVAKSCPASAGVSAPIQTGDRSNLTGGFNINDGTVPDRLPDQAYTLKQLHDAERKEVVRTLRDRDPRQREIAKRTGWSTATINRDIAKLDDEGEVVPATLPALAEQANLHHFAAETRARSALVSAWRSGDALLKAKKQIGHGGFMAWLGDNFDGSERNARNYMALAKSAGSADLNPGQSIAAALRAIRQRNVDENKDAKDGYAAFKRRLSALSRAAERVTITPERASEVIALMETVFQKLNPPTEIIDSEVVTGE